MSIDIKGTVEILIVAFFLGAFLGAITSTLFGAMWIVYCALGLPVFMVASILTSGLINAILETFK